MQGINGRYTRFQDSTQGPQRDQHGLPIHPLEQHPSGSRVEGQLVFTHDNSEVRAFRHLAIPGANCLSVLQNIVPPSTRQLLTRLGEAGWLYRRVTNCIESKLRDSTAGTIELVIEPIPLHIRAPCLTTTNVFYYSHFATTYSSDYGLTMLW